MHRHGSQDHFLWARQYLLNCELTPHLSVSSSSQTISRRGCEREGWDHRLARLVTAFVFHQVCEKLQMNVEPLVREVTEDLENSMHDGNRCEWIARSVTYHSNRWRKLTGEVDPSSERNCAF